MTFATLCREADRNQNEIVPEALHYRFGWDDQHDAAAARIIAEFKLVRELAFVRVAQGEIVPFGKYKGWLIEDVMERDPQYLEWLASQPDFRERHPRLFQTIVENDLGPEDAPEPEDFREYEFGCRKCGGPMCFGYRDKSSGELHWYCTKHRLAQWWADAKEPVP